MCSHKQLKASVGEQTIGSPRTLNEVLTKIGQFVSSIKMTLLIYEIFY